MTDTPTLPRSWSELTWQQITAMWTCKMRYGGQADVARVAALLALLGCEVVHGQAAAYDGRSGERLYRLRDKDGGEWTVTAREAATLARRVLPWLDYPYGDPGDDAVKDEKGKVVKEQRDGVAGYVGPMRDALQLQQEQVSGNGGRSWWRKLISSRFALPQVACNNLTWQQYRSLQGIAPGLFDGSQSAEAVADTQAQFLAHILVPRSLALLDTTGGSIRLRPHWEYRYDMARADSMTAYWRRRLADGSAAALFHVCFQAYQTAIAYYAKAYPLLFGNNGGSDPMRDALQGETGTINALMMKGGYAEQQQVYDTPLPFIFDLLNTMTKEAKEIERINAKIKKK